AALADDVPSGTYDFALYRWTKTGIRPDEVLVPVTSDRRVEESLLRLLELATDADGTADPDLIDREALDAYHHSKWIDAHASYVSEHRRLIEHRIQSLTVSHRPR